MSVLVPVTLFFVNSWKLAVVTSHLKQPISPVGLAEARVRALDSPINPCCVEPVVSLPSLKLKLRTIVPWAVR